MSNFEFVVTSGGPQPADRAARSHAIKTALQSRSKRGTGESLQSGVAESERTAQSRDVLNGKFRVALVEGRRDRRKGQAQPNTPLPDVQGCKQPLPDSETINALVRIGRGNGGNHNRPGLEWLGLGFLDPFGTIPIPSNTRTDSLIKHCIIFFDYLTTTVISHQTWLALAMHDSLLMRVTLSMTAAYGATQTHTFNQNLKREGWKLKGQVIGEVNHRIQTGQVTENTLAAIAHLGRIASLEGSPEEADMHIQGLQKLVALKGGIRAINNYQVGRFINSIDLELATQRKRKPYFPLNYDLSRAQVPPSIADKFERLDLSQFQRLGSGHEKLTAAVHLLRQIIKSKKSNMDQTLRDVRVLSFSVAHLALDEIGNTPTSPEGQCLHALFLAIHLFACAALSHHHHWTNAIAPKMALRLKESLRAWPSYPSIWINYLPELLWALFVGTVVDQDPKEKKSWFLSQLKVVWRLLQGKPRTEFERYIRSMAWDDEFGTEFLDMWFYNGALPIKDNRATSSITILKY